MLNNWLGQYGPNQLFGIYNQIDEILSKGNIEIEDLLVEEEFIPEIKQKNLKLMDYFTKGQSQIQQLVDYITIEPLETQSQDRKYKYPYLSCEILELQVDEILNTLFEPFNQPKNHFEQPMTKVLPIKGDDSIEDEQEGEEEEVIQKEVLQNNVQASENQAQNLDQDQQTEQKNEKSSEPVKQSEPASLQQVEMVKQLKQIQQNIQKQEINENEEDESKVPSSEQTDQPSIEAEKNEENQETKNITVQTTEKLEVETPQTLLDWFFQFLETRDRLNQTLAGYFSQLFMNLLKCRQKAFLNYIISNYSVLKNMIYHIRTPAITECLLKILTIEGTQIEDKCDKFIEIKLEALDKITENLGEFDEFETTSISSLFCELITKYYLIWDGREILDFFIGEQTCARLFNILVDCQKEYCKKCALEILSSLAQYYSYNCSLFANDYPQDSEYYQVMKQKYEEIPYVDSYSKSLKRIVCFLKVQVSRSLTEIPDIKVSALTPPLGMFRAKLVEFFGILITINIDKVFAPIVEEKVMLMIFELFFRYPWNNILHASVERIWNKLFLKEKYLVLLEQIFYQFKFLDRIIDSTQHHSYQSVQQIEIIGQEDQPIQNRQNNMIIGYQGHIIQMMTNLIQSRLTAVYIEPIFAFLQNKPEYIEFKQELLDHHLEKQKTDLGEFSKFKDEPTPYPGEDSYYGNNEQQIQYSTFTNPNENTFSQVSQLEINNETPDPEPTRNSVIDNSFLLFTVAFMNQKEPVVEKENQLKQEEIEQNQIESVLLDDQIQKQVENKEQEIENIPEPETQIEPDTSQNPQLPNDSSQNSEFISDADNKEPSIIENDYKITQEENTEQYNHDENQDQKIIKENEYPSENPVENVQNEEIDVYAMLNEIALIQNQINEEIVKRNSPQQPSHIENFSPSQGTEPNQLNSSDRENKNPENPINGENESAQSNKYVLPFDCEEEDNEENNQFEVQQNYRDQEQPQNNQYLVLENNKLNLLVCDILSEPKQDEIPSAVQEEKLFSDRDLEVYMPVQAQLTDNNKDNIETPPNKISCLQISNDEEEENDCGKDNNDEAINRLSYQDDEEQQQIPLVEDSIDSFKPIENFKVLEREINNQEEYKSPQDMQVQIEPQTEYNPVYEIQPLKLSPPQNILKIEDIYRPMTVHYQSPSKQDLAFLSSLTQQNFQNVHFQPLPKEETQVVKQAPVPYSNQNVEQQQVNQDIEQGQNQAIPPVVEEKQIKNEFHQEELKSKIESIIESTKQKFIGSTSSFLDNISDFQSYEKIRETSENKPSTYQYIETKADETSELEETARKRLIFSSFTEELPVKENLYSANIKPQVAIPTPTDTNQNEQIDEIENQKKFENQTQQPTLEFFDYSTGSQKPLITNKFTKQSVEEKLKEQVLRLVNTDLKLKEDPLIAKSESPKNLINKKKEELGDKTNQIVNFNAKPLDQANMNLINPLTSFQSPRNVHQRYDSLKYEGPYTEQITSLKSSLDIPIVSTKLNVPEVRQPIQNNDDFEYDPNADYSKLKSSHYSDSQLALSGVFSSQNEDNQQFQRLEPVLETRSGIQTAESILLQHEIKLQNQSHPHISKNNHNNNHNKSTNDVYKTNDLGKSMKTQQDQDQEILHFSTVLDQVEPNDVLSNYSNSKDSVLASLQQSTVHDQFSWKNKRNDEVLNYSSAQQQPVPSNTTNKQNESIKQHIPYQDIDLSRINSSRDEINQSINEISMRSNDLSSLMGNSQICNNNNNNNINNINNNNSAIMNNNSQNNSYFMHSVNNHNKPSSAVASSVQNIPAQHFLNQLINNPNVSSSTESFENMKKYKLQFIKKKSTTNTSTISHQNSSTISNLQDNNNNNNSIINDSFRNPVPTDRESGIYNNNINNFNNNVNSVSSSSNQNTNNNNDNNYILAHLKDENSSHRDFSNRSFDVNMGSGNQRNVYQQIFEKYEDSNHPDGVKTERDGQNQIEDLIKQYQNISTSDSKNIRSGVNGGKFNNGDASHVTDNNSNPINGEQMQANQNPYVQILGQSNPTHERDAFNSESQSRNELKNTFSSPSATINKINNFHLDLQNVNNTPKQTKNESAQSPRIVGIVHKPVLQLFDNNMNNPNSTVPPNSDSQNTQIPNFGRINKSDYVSSQNSGSNFGNILPTTPSNNYYVSPSLKQSDSREDYIPNLKDATDSLIKKSVFNNNNNYPSSNNSNNKIISNNLGNNNNNTNITPRSNPVIPDAYPSNININNPNYHNINQQSNATNNINAPPLQQTNNYYNQTSNVPTPAQPNYNVNQYQPNNSNNQKTTSQNSQLQPEIQTHNIHSTYQQRENLSNYQVSQTNQVNASQPPNTTVENNNSRQAPPQRQVQVVNINLMALGEQVTQSNNQNHYPSQQPSSSSTNTQVPPSSLNVGAVKTMRTNTSNSNLHNNNNVYQNPLERTKSPLPIQINSFVKPEQDSYNKYLQQQEYIQQRMMAENQQQLINQQHSTPQMNQPQYLSQQAPQNISGSNSQPSGSQGLKNNNQAFQFQSIKINNINSNDGDRSKPSQIETFDKSRPMQEQDRQILNEIQHIKEVTSNNSILDQRQLNANNYK